MQKSPEKHNEKFKSARENHRSDQGYFQPLNGDHREENFNKNMRAGGKGTNGTVYQAYKREDVGQAIDPSEYYGYPVRQEPRSLRESQNPYFKSENNQIINEMERSNILEAKMIHRENLIESQNMYNRKFETNYYDINNDQSRAEAEEFQQQAKKYYNRLLNERNLNNENYKMDRMEKNLPNKFTYKRYNDGYYGNGRIQNPWGVMYYGYPKIVPSPQRPGLNSKGMIDGVHDEHDRNIINHNLNNGFHGMINNSNEPQNNISNPSNLYSMKENQRENQSLNESYIPSNVNQVNNFISISMTKYDQNLDLKPVIADKNAERVIVRLSYQFVDNLIYETCLTAYMRLLDNCHENNTNFNDKTNPSNIQRSVDLGDLFYVLGSQWSFLSPILPCHDTENPENERINDEEVKIQQKDEKRTNFNKIPPRFNMRPVKLYRFKSKKPNIIEKNPIPKIINNDKKQLSCDKKISNINSMKELDDDKNFYHIEKNQEIDTNLMEKNPGGL